jgi:putative transposase
LNVVIELGREIGFKPACEALEVSRATVYRRLKPKARRPHRPSPRALSAEERQRVLDVLHSETFRDLSVPEVYATLLTSGEYLASTSTMYRVLRAASGTRERRNIRNHPTYQKPELVATGPIGIHLG